mmetsp:Transcript_24273/g.76312  ORF Transcript_24273/g.76312 Transcript_24273/m.76312 type:complete len:225 (-) Transcript_24273:562-1236(-)
MSCSCCTFSQLFRASSRRLPTSRLLSSKTWICCCSWAISLICSKHASMHTTQASLMMTRIRELHLSLKSSKSTRRMSSTDAMSRLACDLDRIVSLPQPQAKVQGRPLGVAPRSRRQPWRPPRRTQETPQSGRVWASAPAAPSSRLRRAGMTGESAGIWNLNATEFPSRRFMAASQMAWTEVQRFSSRSAPVSRGLSEGLMRVPANTRNQAVTKRRSSCSISSWT